MTGPQDEQDELLLRLRVEELERGIEQAWEQVATQANVLDDVEGSRWWRAGGSMRRARWAMRPDVRAAAERAAPGAARIPLAGLHARTTSGRAATWREDVVVDGVGLPAVLADPPEEISYRAVPAPGLRLRAFAALRPAGWIGNSGGVVFTMSVIDAAGAEVRSASLHADPVEQREHRGWLALELDLDGLPAHEHRIVLRTEVPAGATGAYAWAVWGDPVLLLGPPADDGPASLSAALAGELRGVIERRLPSRDVPDDGAPAAHPVISLLVPVHDPEPALLEALLHSVRTQTSPHWQVCVCDDGSRDPAVRALLRDAAAADARIVVTRHAEARNISAATNAALGLATGDYVAPLDHDDLLHPDAIADCGAVLAADPSLDMVYTDNDKVVPDGRRLAPSLKPDWSPEHLRALMYTLHLGVYRRALVEELGGWRSAFDGAQDHDLVLRLSERTSRIAHVPRLRYSWRAHAGSAALSAQAKPEAYDRGCAAVQEHLERTGVAGRAERLPEAGRYRVVHEPIAAAVDVILPLMESAAAGDVAAAVRALGAVTVVAGPGGGEAVDAAVAAGAAVVSGHDRRWGALARAGIAATSAPFVVLLEELCVPVTEDWRGELCGLAAEPAIAAAGALVVADDDTVVHAGVALPRGLPLPVHPGAPAAGDDVAPELTVVTNRSAVSGAAAMRRERVAGDAGPDPRAEHHALAALTLGLTARAGRVVHTPHARLRIAGPARGTVAGIAELAAVARERGSRPDPYYNPQLWADRAAHVAPAALTR